MNDTVQLFWKINTGMDKLLFKAHYSDVTCVMVPQITGKSFLDDKGCTKMYTLEFLECSSCRDEEANISF